MEAATQPKLGTQFTAAMAWWRDAGVDLDFADAPTRWLAEDDALSGSGPSAVAGPPAVAGLPPLPAARAATVPDQRPAIGGPRAGWPQDLAGFTTWWLSEPALDDGAVRGRVAPRGPAEAELMIIVPQPEATDAAETTGIEGPDGAALLSGPDGRLLDSILGAMGVAPDRVYYAAVLPRHTPLADWPALTAEGIGEVLAHHIALAAPKRLILFGTNILPLLGHDPAQNGNVLQTFNHEGCTIPLLGALELGAMLGRPKWKAAFWQRWLDWTGTTIA